MNSGAPRRHILTVVLEDYFQVAALSPIIPRRYWPRFESHVERHTEAALDLLDSSGVRATFFTLGWTAERCPNVIAEVARRGHEVASKGYFHRGIRTMSREEFVDDALRARDTLEQAANAPVRGYRIARGGVTGPQDLWMLDVLAEHGFEYDSSLRPFGRAFASEPFRRFVHQHHGGGHRIWEVPVSSLSIGGYALPIAGGNFVRQLPGTLVRRALDSWEYNFDAPIVFYFHVWELDPGQPRISGVPALQRVRHYRNLAAMKERIQYYLSRYRFTSISEHLDLAAPQIAERSCRVSPSPQTENGSRALRTLHDPVPFTCVVPCYNEQATLPYLARTLDLLKEEMIDDDSRLSFLFVDDGSVDDTWGQLTKLFGARPDCSLVRHEHNRGVAAATLTGIARAQTEIVAVIDCDCSYDPEQLRVMLPMLADDVALVTASPYHCDGKVENIPGWRLFLSRGLSLLYRQVLNHRLATYTSCFRVYRRSAVAGLTVTHEGFLGIAEILARLDMGGARIVECPAVLEARLLGQSKMKVLKTIAGHLGLLARLITRRWGLGDAVTWENSPSLRTSRSRN